ncbi:MAG: tRNA pseudouridine(13) synthase TruD [Candidatus Jordarchaeales archaeon]|nr:tRNA pseudouridine(13) synthase TruD [Candidatus Jordarchaeia archaeon]
MDLEFELGMRFFITKTPGVGGRLRVKPEDFVVEEVTPEGEVLRRGVDWGTREGEGDYCVFIVERHGTYDTFEMIRRMARALRVSRKRFSYAGVKDKRAIAVQRMSAWKVEPETIMSLKIRGVVVRGAWRSAEEVKLGDLWGNFFRVNVREIRLPVWRAEERILKVIEELKAEGGVPNFYGHQRFGVTRPVTHMVGLRLLKGEFREAAMEFLSQVYPMESEEAKEARRYLTETMDFKGALKRFPNYLVYERAMLNHLVKFPNDFVGAFRRLPRGLALMFVHAAQSYIFNLILSERRTLGLPLNRVNVGDFAVTLKNGLPESVMLVDEGNVDRINSLIERGQAALALPIIGYDTNLPSGSIQEEIVKHVLLELELSLDSFKVKSMPELAARGDFRQALVNPPMLRLVRVSADKDLDGVTASLHFSLPKGSYATCLAREIMKTDPTKY